MHRRLWLLTLGRFCFGCYREKVKEEARSLSKLASFGMAYIVVSGWISSAPRASFGCLHLQHKSIEGIYGIAVRKRIVELYKRS